MTLGDLIDTLEALKPDLPIRFDHGGGVGPLMSWRGIYAELTLTPGTKALTHRTVGEVLEDALDADGGTFQGYKGGDYVMSRSTAVWADDYGDCDYWALSGVSLESGTVVVHRMNVADYR